MLVRLALGLGLLISMAQAQEVYAAMVISNDHGGRIGDYIAKYTHLSYLGEKVVIDGTCASACTIVLAAVSHDNICVTHRARLGFHQAFDYGQAKSGAHTRVANLKASSILLALYPAYVQDWIKKRGGLPPPSKMIWLEGRSLTHMYRVCGKAKTRL